jgi:uncharacterized protein (DUF1697 family)
VALLRAVNLGPRNKVSMPALRELVRSLGHGDAETYLQSGNVVFSSDRADADGLAGELRAALSGRLGLDVDVLLRTGEELAAVVAANPFPEALEEPAKLHEVFLNRDPEPGRHAVLDPSAYEPDAFRFGTRAVYVHYPNGAGRSKLTADVWRRLGVVATARNWNTVTKLVALTTPEAGTAPDR